jgi:26S proteasome non-ATPase regulatory subunit 10
MVELLLKNKSPVNATDVAGQTPLHHAIAEGHGDTAVALLKAGAETGKKDVDGFLAMDLAPDAQVKSTLLIHNGRY